MGKDSHFTGQTVYSQIVKITKNTEKRAKNVGLKSSYTALNTLWFNALHAKM